MTDTQIHVAFAVLGYGGVATFCGYCFGSMRTFASLGYGSETIRAVLRTMRPWFGNRDLAALMDDGNPQWLRFLAYFDVPTSDQSKRL